MSEFSIEVPSVFSPYLGIIQQVSVCRFEAVPFPDPVFVRLILVRVLAYRCTREVPFDKIGKLLLPHGLLKRRYRDVLPQ